MNGPRQGETEVKEEREKGTKKVKVERVNPCNVECIRKG